MSGERQRGEVVTLVGRERPTELSVTGTTGIGQPMMMVVVLVGLVTSNGVMVMWDEWWLTAMARVRIGFRCLGIVSMCQTWKQNIIVENSTGG